MSRMTWDEFLRIVRDKNIPVWPLSGYGEGGAVRIEVVIERGPDGYRRYRVVGGPQEVYSREFGDDADLTDQIAAIVRESIKGASGPGGLPRAN